VSALGGGRHPSLDERDDPAIQIVEYDKRWPALAETELSSIGAALGAVAVRSAHVGSTAVPGLGAKPIIDLQVSVTAIDDRSAYVPALENLGYLFAPTPDSPDFHFFGKPGRRPRRLHLHVCAAGGSDEWRHLAVRDYLRGNASEAAQYEALKKDLVARHPGDRLAYIAGKRPYMEALEARALRWSGGPSWDR